MTKDSQYVFHSDPICWLAFRLQFNITWWQKYGIVFNNRPKQTVDFCLGYRKTYFNHTTIIICIGFFLSSISVTPSITMIYWYCKLWCKYTIDNILIEVFVLHVCPACSRHNFYLVLLLLVFCGLVFLRLIFTYIMSQFPTQNASYLHHNKTSPEFSVFK